MIILLTGPTGSGKTDVSWALIEQSTNMVFLDCDWFASYTPFDWENEHDVEGVFQALSIMIQFHLEHGRKNFVIPMTIQMAKLFKKNDTYFLGSKLPIKKFRLRCDNAELSHRIKKRDRIDFQKQGELNNVEQAQSTFDQLFPKSDIFYLIDTTHLTESDVAKKILENV